MNPQALSTPARARANGPRRQHGVSMIELLVALVIFAFGMLGMAGLQTRALQYGQSSLHRSQATALADDLIDRLRTDRTTAVTASSAWNTDFINTAASITGTTFADTDLKDWKTQVEALLPSGAAKIEITVGGDVTVTLRWDESRVSTDDSAPTLVTKSRI